MISTNGSALFYISWQSYKCLMSSRGYVFILKQTKRSAPNDPINDRHLATGSGKTTHMNTFADAEMMGYATWTFELMHFFLSCSLSVKTAGFWYIPLDL